MSLFGRTSQKKDQGESDSFWINTDYGYAPKDIIKVYYSSDWDSGRGLWIGIAVDSTIEEYQKLKALESKKHNLKELLIGSCILCNKKFLIPSKQKPIFFKCPFCSPKEEKQLIESLLFQNPNNEIFKSCPGCDRYNYIGINDHGNYIRFQCKSCNDEFILRKDHEINLENFSDKSMLNWCSACGHIFENPFTDNYPIKCPRCESHLEPKSYE